MEQNERLQTDALDRAGCERVFTDHASGAKAQFERDLIRERTNAGLQAARARGHMGGRPSKLSEKDRTRIRELYQDSTLTVQEITDQYHVSRGTIYMAINSPSQ